MSLSIDQKPLYNILPVGQEIIFTVSDSQIVATKFNVKFTAIVTISTTSSGVNNITVPYTQVATLEVNPNNSGVGIFSTNEILESYVSPQYKGTDFNGVIQSSWQNIKFTEDTPHPIHVIDEFSLNRNNATWFGLMFNVTWYDTADLINQQTNSSLLLSEKYVIYNGVLDYDAILREDNGNYGFNLDVPKLVFNLEYGEKGKFLSNAPIEQNASLEDYGTLAFFNFLSTANDGFQIGAPSNPAPFIVQKMQVKMYDSSDTLLATLGINNQVSNGGLKYGNDDSWTRFMYFGAFPANLRGHSLTFRNFMSNTSYYTIQALDDSPGTQIEISQLYKINIKNQNACAGFESIRLTWLNPHGAWDYYNFRMKSIRSLQTNRTNYTQLGGTWNDKQYRINGYKGGKKNFRVNTKEIITINTEFVTDEDAVWFEDLINSTEVFILKGYVSSGVAVRDGMTNRFVEPVSVTTSSYIRKTKVNDKLIQYTFELEKTNNKRTQSV